MGLKFNLQSVFLLVGSQGGIRKVCSGPALSWLRPDQCLQGLRASLLEWCHSGISVSFLAQLLSLTLSYPWGRKQNDSIVVAKSRVKVQERLEVSWDPHCVCLCEIAAAAYGSRRQLGIFSKVVSAQWPAFTFRPRPSP